MHSSRSADAPASSLPEMHSSVATRHTGVARRLFAFSGPAFLVSAGYMDPGNWATDLEGGARFGYRLLWVLVLSNAMAILLQTLSARLGIATGRDLAQACREIYPRAVSLALWGLCEIAIVACDLAEVLGAAIGLNLLFHVPLLAGVLLTAADTLLILWFTRLGIRVMESFVLALILVIAACFGIELWWARPALAPLVAGLVPRLGPDSLYVAVAMIGATVMPHNLYLHSALVQTRRIGAGEADKRVACRYNFFDSLLALNGALLVNAAILVLAAAVFFTRGVVVTEIQQAHLLLSPLLGATLAGVVFAVALLCSGQASTLTGTMAGQIVMEGFLNLRMRLWLRRMLTRTAAIVPAAITVYLAGEAGTYRLLILSQVILNLQLPFAVLPLIHFTGDRARMGSFRNPAWVRGLAWLAAALILGLNGWLTWTTLAGWFAAAGAGRFWLAAAVLPVLAALLWLLVWIAVQPYLPGWQRRLGRTAELLPEYVAAPLPQPSYRRILVPLDHTARDHDAIAHAAALARAHQATVYLLHVEEDVTSQLFGALASTAEVAAGHRYLEDIARDLSASGVETKLLTRFSRDPRAEIVRSAKAIAPDLIVMGAHGHKGIKDIIFGTTINAVRHQLKIPLLIVRGQP